MAQSLFSADIEEDVDVDFDADAVEEVEIDGDVDAWMAEMLSSPSSSYDY
jgi:hypothetical protein